MATHIITALAGGLLVFYLGLRFLASATHDAKEPPMLGTGVPFVGALLGMIKEKERFYVRLRNEYQLPIYTLRLPFMRMYIVNETSLIPLIQKQWHHINFSAIAAEAGTTVGMSPEALKVMRAGLTTDHGFSTSWVRFVMPSLSPGKDLDNMNRTAVEVIAAATDKLRADGATTISLKQWTREVLVRATTEAVWGPENPYRDSGVREAWTTFEAGFMTFSMFPGAKYFFPKLLRARELVAAALIEYMRKGGYKKASGLVQRRYQHHVKEFGLSHDDFARGELGNTFAVVGSTIPCSFWVLWHVFSDERVLHDVREEVNGLVQEDDESGSRTVDLSGVRESCPVLLSTFQEVLRYRAVNPGPRVLLEDVELEGNILLKKGSMLMIPAPVHHSSVPAWGEDAGVFDHRRFERKRSEPGKRKPNKAAFRAFGGGHQLCPGRHFASTELLALTALLVLQFDIVPASGKWVEPTSKNSPAQTGFPVPDQDVDVKLQPRGTGKPWNVKFLGSNAMMGIVAEDLADDQD